MNRRDFHLRMAGALAAGFASSACAATKAEPWPASPWELLENASGGRMGMAVMHADGRIDGHRLDERFPMCSTFKWLAAACVLRRVDDGQEQLDRRIEFGPEVLLPHSPVTSTHAGTGMTLGELCAATIATSDNAAANLILATFGGPAGLTSYARTLGDSVTRLDRTEPELNEAEPGDPRDTTSPRAMAGLLHATLVGAALSGRGREQLSQWMEATRTNQKRLRADLPEGWRMGSKTGSGPRGTTNDVGIFWPPGGAPIVVVAYLTESRESDENRNGAIAQLARKVVSMQTPAHPGNAV